MNEMRGGFSKLLDEEQFEKVETSMVMVQISQEKGISGDPHRISAPLEPVIDPLNIVLARVNDLQGWARYREEFAEFGASLIQTLNSPVVNAAIEAEKRRLERFPDPHHVVREEAHQGSMKREDWMMLGLTFLLLNQMNQNNR